VPHIMTYGKSDHVYDMRGFVLPAIAKGVIHRDIPCRWVKPRGIFLRLYNSIGTNVHLNRLLIFLKL
jgi:hypothetical protein